MTLTTKNIIANFAGSGWSALMGLIFLPFYIKIMGPESFGIVGIFASLQAIFSILDLGLSQTLNREMARLSANPENSTIMVDTARTMELVYWGIAIGLVVILGFLSDFIAFRWLNPGQLSPKKLAETIWIMAFVLGLRWPVNLYMGGLNGLQRQVAVNIINSIFVTFQGVGALVVLWFYAPTIRAFFLWQGVIASLQVITFFLVFWQSFPFTQRGKFQGEVLKRVRSFAVGITGISILSVILTQLDKIILSKLLPLSEFGYYSFAATIAAALYKLISPVYTAYFPRFTLLVTQNDQLTLSKTYHQGCQLMTLVILPISLSVAFFSKEILELWARNPDVVKHSYLVLSLLIVGNAFNGLYYLPVALQLASGWTQLVFYQNVIAVIILAPAIYYSTSYWGAVGAASVWILLNTGYLLISVQLMHRRLLINEKLSWYTNDVAKPLIFILLVCFAGRFIYQQDWGDVATILFLLTFLGTSSISAYYNLHYLRGSMRHFLRETR